MIISQQSEILQSIFFVLHGRQLIHLGARMERVQFTGYRTLRLVILLEWEGRSCSGFTRKVRRKKHAYPVSRMALLLLSTCIRVV